MGDSGTNTNVQTPKQITAAADWKSVAGFEYNTCAIRSFGKLYCWGSDTSGQIGDGGANSNSTVPKQVTDPYDV